MHDITLIIVMVLTILGPAAVIAAVGYSAVHALGRNPSSAPKIMIAMIVTLIFAGGVDSSCAVGVFSFFWEMR